MPGLIPELEPNEAPEPRDVWAVLKDVETRVRRLEKVVWSVGGGVLALQLLRACVDGAR